MTIVRTLGVATLYACFTTAAACSNLLIGRHASATGSPQIAYTSDAGFQYGAIGHYPAGKHPPGTMRDVFNEDSGAYTGQIPEAAQTYNAIAYHGGMNEHQLAISETTFGGLSVLDGQVSWARLRHYMLVKF